jgi:putative addiction module component (TIGR02574 family)
MIGAIDHLKSQANDLTTAERAELAYYLLASLEPEDDDATEAWRVEIARRMADIRSGKAIGRPAEEVIKEMREKHP